MSEDRKLEIAKEYVDKQLETMKQYGSAPKDLSEQEYKAMIAQIADVLPT
jgi:hypothetical protein